MLIAEKSSEVRQNWAQFMDTVIHRAPKLVQRNERDVFMAMNLEFLSVMLNDVRYAVQIEYDQDANEFVATMDGFWFVESAATEEEAMNKLVKQLLDYSLDYFKEIETHFHAPNLKAQLPKVIKALVINDIQGIKQFFDVEHV